MFVAVNMDVITAAAKSRLNLAIASQKMAYITGSASSPPYSSGMSRPSQPLLGHLLVGLVGELPRLVVLARVLAPDLVFHEVM